MASCHCNFKNYIYNKGEGGCLPLFCLRCSLYSNLGNKVNKVKKALPLEVNADFLLSDFLDHRFNLLTKEEYLKAFSNELKLVLAKNTLADIIEAFFELESHHHLAETRVGFETKDIRFDEFYKNLSPVLLKSLFELKSDFAHKRGEKIEQTLIETLRISIEDEFDQFLTKEIH